MKNTLKKAAKDKSLDDVLGSLVSETVGMVDNPQKDIPKIAKDSQKILSIEQALKEVPSSHKLFNTDARHLDFLEDKSIHLILTSPPYWTLKQYNGVDGQLGALEDYELFLDELDKVWEQCYRLLAPGGRLICVVGDVCLSRRKNNGRHTVVPFHSSIQERCRKLGFDNLAPIIWYKIANASYEVKGGSTFMGKPYEPNSIIKNDIEFILMQRKPGGYRNPSVAARVLSVISEENHKNWFQQIWQGLTGASTRYHPAPFPVELAERLIRMFSFVGDTILDPFMGTGSTNIAAAKWARNSIGVEVDPDYFQIAHSRVREEASGLFSKVSVEVSSSGEIK